MSGLDALTNAVPPAPKVPEATIVNSPGGERVPPSGTTGAMEQVNLNPSSPNQPNPVVTDKQIEQANVNFEKAKALPDPGQALGQQIGEVQKKDQSDKVRREAFAGKDKPAEVKEDQRMKDLGHTPLDSHPPLKPGDKIQGPLDRGNREPTEEELANGKLVLGYAMSDEDKAKLAKPEIIDPPIDENAPPDRMGTPQEIAKARGIIL